MRVLELLKRKSPTILSCVGAVGVVVTSVSAAKAATKASVILTEAEKIKGEELSFTEKVKEVGPVFVPTMIFGATTIACIFSANVLNKRNQAALTSAYALIDNSFKRYKGKVKELYGEEVHQNVMDAIVKEECKDVHINAPCMLTSCSQGFEDDPSEPRLFYDEYSNRYFETTIEKVLMAEYHLNRNFVLRGCAALNEFYEFLGLELTDYGDVVGWSVYDEVYWIDFNHRKVVIGDDLECYLIEMPYCPRRRIFRSLKKIFRRLK